MNSSGWTASVWNCSRTDAGKSVQVVRDDRPRPAVDRRRQHVAVVRVGEGQGGDEGLVASDKAVGDVLIHQLPTPGEAFGRDVRAVGQDVPRPLVVDLVRPAGPEQIRQGEPHEQITERGRIQDARVIKNDPGHGSVAHFEVLAQGLELIKCGVTPGLVVLLVGEQVL